MGLTGRPQPRKLSSLDTKVHEFFNTRSEKWYVEGAKHLVLGYTMMRFSEDNSAAVVLGATAIEMGKLIGYLATGAYLAEMI